MGWWFSLWWFIGAACTMKHHCSFKIKSVLDILDLTLSLDCFYSHLFWYVTVVTLAPSGNQYSKIYRSLFHFAFMSRLVLYVLRQLFYDQMKVQTDISKKGTRHVVFLTLIVCLCSNTETPDVAVSHKCLPTGGRLTQNICDAISILKSCGKETIACGMSCGTPIMWRARLQVHFDLRVRTRPEENGQSGHRRCYWASIRKPHMSNAQFRAV